jgi:hypothetical protein
MQDIHAALEGDGTILYAGARYRAISKFALVVLRERNPSRQVGQWVGSVACGCWGDEHCRVWPAGSFVMEHHV